MLKDGDPIGTVAITGAFSYTGKYATRLLLDCGYRVRTQTYHPDRENPFGDRVEVFPYCFEDPDRLSQIPRGATYVLGAVSARRVHLRDCHSKHSHADHRRKKRRRQTHRAR